MKLELISVIGLLLCLLIIGIEYIFLYRLAERQDEHTARLCTDSQQPKRRGNSALGGDQRRF